MNRWSALAALLLAFAAALALRLPNLSARPLHNDEAVNATKVAELYEHGRYRYDPDEFHGPTLHYFSLPFLWLSGADFSEKGEVTDGQLRLVTVFFGAALILLLPLFFDGLPKSAIIWSAIFIATSNAMVFYSRYFIHEMLLVFFTALLLGSLWRYFQSRHAKWAVLAGASAGLMYATKETFVITLAAIFIAAITTIGRAPRSTRAAGASEPPTATPITRHLTLAFAAAVAIWLLFFSSFFTNVAGLVDSIRTYLPWLKRAGGHSPHIHPWYFYLQRLFWFHPPKSPVWNEGPLLTLAVVGAYETLRSHLRASGRTNDAQCSPPSTLPLFITLYTVVLIGAYSVISYKTPWCLLSFHYGLILLAGTGATCLMKSVARPSTRALMFIVLLGSVGQMVSQTYRGNFVYFADRRNPYVYAQTVPDLLNLVKEVEAIAAISPAAHKTAVKVISPGGDYWPLPWYLRRFENVGWYEQLPDDPFAPIIIVSSQLDARLDEKSDKKWIMVGLTEQRPQKFFELYVETELWKKYVASLPPARD
jgi:uncharacterized protein (TIGR03663 family)